MNQLLANVKIKCFPFNKPNFILTSFSLISASDFTKTALYNVVSVSANEWSDCVPQSQTAASLVRCGVLCQKSELCFGFHFDEDLKECQTIDYWLDTFTSGPLRKIYRTYDVGKCQKAIKSFQCNFIIKELLNKNKMYLLL